MHLIIMGSYQLGAYKPSYLGIRINSLLDFSNVQNLHADAQALYFHEYIHFLQDIITTFGLSNSWNTYDRIRQIISLAQKKDSELNIPLSGVEVKIHQNNLRALNEIKGDCRIRNLIGNIECDIKKISLASSDNIDQVIKGGKIHLLKLELMDKAKNIYNYIFGAEAVSESMAYLIEQKFSKNMPLEGYPYCAAKKLAEFVYKAISENDEFLFTICDVSLMTTSPGFSYYIILLEMSLQEFFPKSSKELFDFSLDILKNRGWNIFEDFEHTKTGLLHVFNRIFNRPEFKETNEWFNLIINNSFELRKSNPYIISSLYNDEPFGKSWSTIVAMLGMPMVYNSENKRWFSSPVSLKQNENNIDPIFLYAFWQLHDLLCMGKNAISCKLIEFCKASNQRDMVDDNCVTSPWEKISGEKVCSFCALWVSYGLENKKVVFNK